MPGTSIERHGFVSCKNLTDQLVADLIANGFVLKFPQTFTAGGAAPTATLEAGANVDPLAATQPWRIRIEGSDTGIAFNVAPPLQLPDSGGVVMETSQMSSGLLGTATAPFVNHAGSGGWVPSSADKAAYPMSYRLTVSRQGFVLYVWLHDSDKVGGKFSWVCVQRPVDSQTGETLVTGKAPVFCVFSTGNKINRFVVREVDVLRPQNIVDATAHSEDSRAIINDKNQVAISEDSKYIITFPNGLNTPRYAYTHELDLIAYTSADVISAWAEVPLTVYGEATPRTYKAMNASGAYNTGMRILMLMQGPGFGA